jgi:hypothetical protein
MLYIGIKDLMMVSLCQTSFASLDPLVRGFNSALSKSWIPFKQAKMLKAEMRQIADEERVIIRSKMTLGKKRLMMNVMKVMAKKARLMVQILQ